MNDEACFGVTKTKLFLVNTRLAGAMSNGICWQLGAPKTVWSCGADLHLTQVLRHVSIALDFALGCEIIGCLVRLLLEEVVLVIIPRLKGRRPASDDQ